MPKVCLFDMDGTLFDHDSALKRDMLKLASPEERELIESIASFGTVEFSDKFKDMPHMRARIDLIRRIPGWWKELQRYVPGWEILNEVQKIGFCVKILTKGPRTKPLAWMEKVECIHHHLGQDVPIDIVGEDKAGTYGRVLVDDWAAYVEKWLEHRPRGLAIMPAHSHNEDFKHENVIRYTGDNLEEVRKALYGAYNRNEKEHWKDVAPVV